MEGLFLGLGYLANYVKAELLVAEGSYAICHQAAKVNLDS